VTVTRTEPVALPSLGESVSEATVVAVHVSPGDVVAVGDPLVEVSTDKVDADVPSPVAGSVTAVRIGPGDTIAVGEVIVEVAPVAAPAERAPDGETVAEPGPARAPVAHSREAAMRGPEAVLVEHMHASRRVPTATTIRELGAGPLVRRRDQLRAAGVELSYTHVIAWALVRAAATVPAIVNRYAERDSGPCRVRDRHVQLGVAVDIERRGGTRMVLVPVLRDADCLEFSAFAAAYDELVAKARAARLGAEDLTGANLVLSNTGGFGSTTGVPRLLEGHSAIVAAGAIHVPPALRRLRPELGVEPTLWLACTYDHRVIQGADSGRFLGTVERLLDGEDGFYEEMFSALGVARPASGAAATVPLSEPVPAAGGPGAEAVVAVAEAVTRFRSRGFEHAALDPLAEPPPAAAEPEPEMAALPAALFGRQLERFGDAAAALRWLQRRYQGPTGFEFEHLADVEKVRWWRERVEGRDPAVPDREVKRRVLRRLLEVDEFERFLQRSWLGQKTLSVEGLDMTIPMVEQLIHLAAASGQDRVVIGMAHRGRLAILTHLAGMPLERLFAEFDAYGDVARVAAVGTTGDVKQHIGWEGEYAAGTATVTVRVQPNPSHLEFVCPVALGVARGLDAAAERRGGVVPVLLHGDASFPAQGVVAETFNLGGLPAYAVGGTVHIVQNNQIGFTTEPGDARSNPRVTDLARGATVPVVHVNGEDVDACMEAVALALDFRAACHRDVIIDVVGYRRLGHNETDEPAYTQPLLYQQIRARERFSDRYARRLLGDGVVDEQELAEWAAQRGERLRAARDRSRQAAPRPLESVGRAVATPGPKIDRSATALRRLGLSLHARPEGFAVHPKLEAFLARRRDGLTGASDAASIDWAHAEALLLAAAATAGFRVRLSGQDVQRGAFTQRHLVLHDTRTGATACPLEQLPGAAPVEVVNSPLSEQAALGFEWGFSTAAGLALVIWEAQFGDFANTAQVLIDQFIAPAHAKWGIDAPMVMLLPHAYEGAGPEHSSGRLERFLSLAAEDGMAVAYPTTAAQYFHLLRGHAQSSPARPLAVMSPKSLLRAPAAAASLDELGTGEFRPVLIDGADPRGAERIVVCSGKVAHDLLARRDDWPPGLALVRLERPAPFPTDELASHLQGATGVVWLQEEPRNMGAWGYVRDRLEALLPAGARLGYVGRPERAAPAEGYPAAHAVEQARIVSAGLAI
jgi:multifunctional 2-oxoglutarate metabolism enzyme